MDQETTKLSQSVASVVVCSSAAAVHRQRGPPRAGRELGTYTLFSWEPIIEVAQTRFSFEKDEFRLA